jgi:hypothetical protein
MLKKYLLWSGLFSFFILLLFYSCKSSTPTQSDQSSGIKDDPSFANDIQPIFNASCALSGCHNTSAQAGLALLQGQAYNNIVNVASTEDTSKKRVLPNDATNSYLVIKIEGR